MAHEVVQIDGDINDSLTDFQLGVYHQIEAHGDQNHPAPDRYSPIYAERDYDYQFDSSTGKVSFGECWLTHSLDVEEFEVIYAFRQPSVYRTPELHKMLASAAGREYPADSGEILPPRAELLIHEFNDRGAIARTTITESEGEIQKSRTTRFGHAQGIGFVEFHRVIKAKEEEALSIVLNDSDLQAVTVRGLTRVYSTDKLLIRRAHKEREKLEKEHQEFLESMEAVHRMRSDPQLYR